MTPQRVTIAVVMCVMMTGCASTNAMSEIELDLTIDRSTFVESESIPFEVRLRNAGPDAATIADFEPENQSVTLVAESSSGSEYLGTQISWSVRNGDPHHDPRERSMFTLEPGDEAVLPGDGLAWLGILPVGEYSVYAAYNSGPNVYAESPRVQIVVEQADPVRFETADVGTHPAFETALSTWTHDEGDARRVFLLHTSANYPPNFARNVRGTPVPDDADLRPASVVFDGAPARHAVWLDGNGDFNVIEVGPQRDASEPRRHPAALQDATILRSPLTDDEGRLHMLVAQQRTGGLLYVRIDATGQVSRRRLNDGAVDGEVHGLLWSRAEDAHLVWKSRRGRALMYTRFNPAEETGNAQTDEIDLVDGTPDFVLVRERYEDEAFRRWAVVVVRDVPEVGGLQSRTIDLATREATSVDAIPVPAGVDVRVVAGTVTMDGEQVYLLADTSGAVYVARVGTEPALPVVKPDGHPLNTDAQPALLSTPISSRRPGTYVLYRPDAGPIQVLKLDASDDGR